MKLFLGGLFGGALVMVFILSLISGIKKSEAYQCHRLVDQSKIYKDFYATDWEIDMCKVHSIDLSDYKIKKKTDVKTKRDSSSDPRVI